MSGAVAPSSQSAVSAVASAVNPLSQVIDLLNSHSGTAHAVDADVEKNKLSPSSSLLFIKDLIHRDMKPDNFVVGHGDRSNIVYLIDFGLAKKYRDYPILSVMLILFSTLIYALIFFQSSGLMITIIAIGISAVAVYYAPLN